MGRSAKKWGLSAEDRKLLAFALREDLGKPARDVTVRALFGNEKQFRRPRQARIICKESHEITLCGLSIVRAVFQSINPSAKIRSDFHDADRLPAGATLALIKAPPEALLMGERTALNFLQHLCAIATLTARFVEAVNKTKLRILDTRKTTPGLRHLEKYAVSCGGGVNHRQGLYDAILIKNNHIDLLGGIDKALARLPELQRGRPVVIVEARTAQEVRAILDLGQNKVNRILLDNMPLDLLGECVALCKGLVETEASGGITLENVRAIAATGVDFASVGTLTHSAGNVDLAMHLEGKT